jgi:hypothetical protein
LNGLLCLGLHRSLAGALWRQEALCRPSTVCQGSDMKFWRSDRRVTSRLLWPGDLTVNIER